MVQMGKQLKDMSITELKGMAYDILAGIENGQRNLQMVNALIREKSTQLPEPIPEVVKE